MKHRFDPNDFIVRRGTHGLGLFATRAYKKGDFIIEYTGELLTTETANERGGQYLFELSDTRVIDGRGREHKARYINHSCKPNAYPEISADEKHVYIFAKRAIKPGEELTYNYGKEFWNTYVKSKGCRCTPCEEKRASATPVAA